MGLNGNVTPAWRIAGRLRLAGCVVTSATTAAAAAGAQVAQVPHQTLSLWNNYQLHPRLAAGFGMSYRSDMFAAIDNTVVLPAYTRVDAAAYFRLTPQLRLQTNVENLFNQAVLRQRRQQHQHFARIAARGESRCYREFLNLILSS